jgi:hypothetical protein
MTRRDIDYAADAVRKSIVEKFINVDLTDLQVVSGERTISVQHAGQLAEGTRHDLLAAVRKATDYDDFWKTLKNDDKYTS